MALNKINEVTPFGTVVFDKTIPTSYMGKVQMIQLMIHALETMHCVEGRMRYIAEICLDEAFNNAIQHGNRGDPRKKIRARVCVDDNRWGAIIEDEGAGFDPEGVPDPTREENVLREGGRGIMLMKEYVDELSYNAKGNVVMLMRRRGE
jgi:serine/threonine-protein kinase RsbW